MSDDKNPRQKITSYFKAVKKPENLVIGKDVCEHECIHNQFYKDCLREQQVECQNDLCINAKTDLKQKIETANKKCQDIEEAIRVCSMVVLEKDKDIEQLRAQLDKVAIKENVASDVASTSKQFSKSVVNVQTQINSNSEAVAVSSALSANMMDGDVRTFNEFSNVFTENELAELRSIGPSTRHDSTFVTASVKYLYKEDLSVLKSKSLTGRSTKRQTKQAVTPKKVSILKAIFSERIHSITNDKNERLNREKSLRTYIKDAINNINRTTTNAQEFNVCNEIQNTLKYLLIDYLPKLFVFVCIVDAISNEFLQTFLP